MDLTRAPVVMDWECIRLLPDPGWEFVHGYMINIGEEVGPMDSSVWTPGMEVGWVLSPQSGLHLFNG